MRDEGSHSGNDEYEHPLVCGAVSTSKHSPTFQKGAGPPATRGFLDSEDRTYWAPPRR